MDLPALRSTVGYLRDVGYLKTLARSRAFTAYGLTEHGCRARLALDVPAEREAPAAMAATAPAPPPPVVPPSTVGRLDGLAAPDRPQATRPGALDFIQCFSRRGDVLVPMSEIHNRGI